MIAASDQSILYMLSGSRNDHDGFVVSSRRLQPPAYVFLCATSERCIRRRLTNFKGRQVDEPESDGTSSPSALPCPALPELR